MVPQKGLNLELCHRLIAEDEYLSATHVEDFAVKVVGVRCWYASESADIYGMLLWKSDSSPNQNVSSK